jgi:hypothetical protein
MAMFTFTPGRGWVVRAFGRNPLVRTSDRIEALVLILAVTVAIVTAPIAGAIGIAVYEEQSHTYAEQHKLDIPSVQWRSRTAAPQGGHTQR